MASTGHYTQMMWAKSQFLGCGHIVYPKGSNTNKYLVCNYGPAGNVVGKAMYQRGTACAKCPSDTTCTTKANETGLCGYSIALSRNSILNHAFCFRLQSHDWQ